LSDKREREGLSIEDRRRESKSVKVYGKRASKRRRSFTKRNKFGNIASKL
jgi:hypothetical protein